jgi:hypothetical protein
MGGKHEKLFESGNYYNAEYEEKIYDDIIQIFYEISGKSKKASDKEKFIVKTTYGCDKACIISECYFFDDFFKLV